MKTSGFQKHPFENTIHHFVDSFLSELPSFFKNIHDEQQKYYSGVPANIKENENAFVIELVAPGFEKSDFRVEVENDLLTVSGEVKLNLHQEDFKSLQTEYIRKNFKRTFTINQNIDTTAIEAKYINGMLVINLPKKKGVKQNSTQIVIN
ncbi:MAG: Hsp20/alpha crystallin family protein [Chitinophagaceae bacterium]|nr:Hsp20/alpha crystallin family protein [Chitinophagaceae bacterium]